MLRGLATIAFWADDIPAARSWYVELLGIEPYFERTSPDGTPAYLEFRVGDYLHELGILDRRYAPSGSLTEPGGAVAAWHVDDIAAVFERLLAMGAREYEPITSWEDGFMSASVVDPFGNVLGLTHNPHYLDVLASRPVTV